jgi:hypothetical protein
VEVERIHPLSRSRGPRPSSGPGWGKPMPVCLALGIETSWLAALAWGCAAKTGPVLGDTPSATTVDAAILDAASERDAGSEASCTGDLSGIGTGDFHISFTVTSTQTPLVALANQRNWCSYTNMWDLRMEAGVPIMELDDEAGEPHYTILWGAGPRIDDGRPHDVLIERVSGTLSVNVDGVAASKAAPASLGPLPPLEVGNDICIGRDGTVLLTNLPTNLCIGKQ